MRKVYEDDNLTCSIGDYNSLNFAFKNEYEGPITLSGELLIPKNGVMYIDVNLGSGDTRVFGTYKNLDNGHIRSAALDMAGHTVLMNIDDGIITFNVI